MEKVSLATNPIRVAREAQNQTLEEFARACGLHHQAIYLNESGVYPKILPSIKEHLISLGYNSKELTKDYKAFVSKTREVFKERYSPTGAWELPEPLVGACPIVRWREQLGLTRSGLAKALCIHPYSLERVEKRRTSTLPEELIKALREIGFSTNLVDELEYQVVEFYFS